MARPRPRPRAAAPLRETGKTFTEDAARVFQEVLSRTRPCPPQNCAPRCCSPDAAVPPRSEPGRRPRSPITAPTTSFFTPKQSGGSRRPAAVASAAPAGSLQPPPVPLLPTRPLRFASSVAVRSAPRDPVELRRGATPEEEALAVGSRLDMALRRPARRTSFRTQLHRPQRRKNSATARELARRSSARSLASAPRGRGLAGLTNRRLQPGGHLDLYLLCWCGSVNIQFADSASR